MSLGKKLLLSLLVAFPLAGFAQPDTNYYHKYTNRLCASLYQSIKRTYNFDISELLEPNNKAKTRLNYNADANLVTGLEFTYDKFSVAFGYRSTPPDSVAKIGKTSHSNYAASIGGNKYFFHGSYIKYKGFYDLNTSAYDTNFTGASAYFQNPSMATTTFKVKFLYFTNGNKFSYKSAYAGNYRQLKSCASWVLVSNVYYQTMKADSSFIPQQVLNSYGTFADWNKLNITGISAGGGASGNLVIGKRLFLNVTFALGFESQWRTYGYLSSGDNKRTYISLSGDLRSALGYNGKNFFCTLSSMNDFSFFNSGQVNVTSRFLSGYFTIGYRFKMRTPKLYQKFQETKVYKML